MKKISILFAVMTMLVGQAFAVTMCVKNNTYIGVLRKNVNGSVTDVTNDTTVGSEKKQWKITFDYKSITGYAACNEISGSFGVAQTNLYTDASNVGQYCWCQMFPIYESGSADYDSESGASSFWVYLKEFTGGSAVSDCASSCTSACANAIANNTDGFRSAIFEAVW